MPPPVTFQTVSFVGGLCLEVRRSVSTNVNICVASVVSLVWIASCDNFNISVLFWFRSWVSLAWVVSLLVWVNKSLCSLRETANQASSTFCTVCLPPLHTGRDKLQLNISSWLRLHLTEIGEQSWMGTVLQSQESFLCLQINLGYYFEWKQNIEVLLWSGTNFVGRRALTLGLSQSQADTYLSIHLNVF